MKQWTLLIPDPLKLLGERKHDSYKTIHVFVVEKKIVMSSTVARDQ